jgi:hypothetical protein
MRRLVPTALLLAAACNTGFDPQYLVTDLRILAVSVEVAGSATADAAPGDAVQLRALVANPLRREPLVVRWFVCPPGEADSVPPCLDTELLKDPTALAAAPGVVEIARGETPSPIPMPELRQATDDAIRLALEEPARACRLFVEVPILVVAEAEGRREVAVKRARLVPRAEDLAPYPELADAYRPNQNPRATGVVRAPGDRETCRDGTSLTAGLPLGRALLCGRATGADTFDVCGAGGERTSVPETYSWQWYVTGGEFPGFDGKGNATGYVIELERPAEEFTLWVIVRDGRGGEGWAEYHLGPP